MRHGNDDGQCTFKAWKTGEVMELGMRNSMYACHGIGEEKVQVCLSWNWMRNSRYACHGAGDEKFQVCLSWNWGREIHGIWDEKFQVWKSWNWGREIPDMVVLEFGTRNSKYGSHGIGDKFQVWKSWH